MLIACEPVFYSWGEPLYIWLMLGSILVNYLMGLLCWDKKGNRGSALALLVGIFIDLGLLILFKYSGFLAENINPLAQKL